jgi:hypothetical protein
MKNMNRNEHHRKLKLTEVVTKGGLTVNLIKFRLKIDLIYQPSITRFIHAIL